MDLAGCIRVTIVASVVLLVLGLGLRSRVGDVTYLLRKPGLLARSLFAMNVVMPLLVVGWVDLLALQPAVEVALLALAVSPVPPFLPDRQIKIGANPAYVYALFATTSVLAILCVPVLTLVFADRVLAGALSLRASQVLGIVFVTTLMPLGLGIAVRRNHPHFAQQAHSILSRVGTSLLLLALALMIVTQWSAMSSLVGDGTLLSIAAFTASGLAVGHLLGGPQSADRRVLALATVSRHPGVALAVATAAFPNQPLAPAAVLLGTLVGMLTAVPYTAWCKRTPQAEG